MQAIMSRERWVNDPTRHTSNYIVKNPTHFTANSTASYPKLANIYFNSHGILLAKWYHIFWKYLSEIVDMILHISKDLFYQSAVKTCVQSIDLQSPAVLWTTHEEYTLWNDPPKTASFLLACLNVPAFN